MPRNHPHLWTVPVAHRDAANAILERQGYGPHNFSIELTNRTGKVVRVATELRVPESVGRGLVRLLAKAIDAAQIKEYRGPHDERTTERLNRAEQSERLTRKESQA